MKPTFKPTNTMTFDIVHFQVDKFPTARGGHTFLLHALVKSPSSLFALKFEYFESWTEGVWQGSATFIFGLFDDNVTKMLKTKRQKVVESMMRKKQTGRSGGGGKKGKGLGLHISWQCQWRSIHLDLEVTSYFGTVSKDSFFFLKLKCTYVCIFSASQTERKKQKKFTSLLSMLVCCKWRGVNHALKTNPKPHSTDIVPHYFYTEHEPYMRIQKEHSLFWCFKFIKGA